MFEILVYLFENYYQGEPCPDPDTLARKLTDAGFGDEDITDALDWLRHLSRPNDEQYPEAFELCDAFRAHTHAELAKLEQALGLVERRSMDLVAGGVRRSGASATFREPTPNRMGRRRRCGSRHRSQGPPNSLPRRRSRHPSSSRS